MVPVSASQSCGAASPTRKEQVTVSARRWRLVTKYMSLAVMVRCSHTTCPPGAAVVHWASGATLSLASASPTELDANTRPLPTRRSASRSEERRVGKECVSTCRSRGSRYHKKQNNHQLQQ